jgi:hypothetical protein
MASIPSVESTDLAKEAQENTEPNPETPINDFNSTDVPNLSAESGPNIKKFKKRGRQREDKSSGEQRVSKISTGGWIETITFMPVSKCPPQCPDCPPPSLSPPEV